MESKAEVRKRMVNARDELGAAYRAEQSEQIAEQVLGSELYRQADVILSYCSFRSEVDTERLNQDILHRGKQLYLPKTYRSEKRIRFYEVKDLRSLKKGYQGILEPDCAGSIEIRFGEQCDTARGNILMVMPGVAFDAAGYRMGYGGGYYDRYMNRYGEWFTSLFIAFQEQKASAFCAEEHDVKPDFILTQEGFQKE